MNTIYVVIVLYKISLFEAESYKTLIKPNNIGEYLVYDNSPKQGYTDVSKLPNGVTYINDTSNSGLSKAYNKAAQIAKEKGYRRVLLLDQDTYFQPESWHKYLKSIDYEGITSPQIVTNQRMPFSPVRINKFFKKTEANVPFGTHSLYKYAVVNSGCCVPTDLFLQCGGYDEKVNLDFSDFQFQVRFRKLCPKFRLIEAQAVQDFSNDCKDFQKVRNRYLLYLKSAKYFKADNAINQMDMTV